MQQQTPDPVQNTSVFAKAIQEMNSTETKTGRPRHIVDAAIIGTCIAFLVSLLGMAPGSIDSDLHIAIRCFAWALPLIGWGYLDAFHQLTEKTGILRQALTVAISFTEAVGQVIALIGLLFVLRHLDAGTTGAIIWGALLAMIGTIPLSWIGLIVYWLVKARGKKPVSPSPTQAQTPP